MAQFTEQQINEIWEKGQIDPKYNPDYVRKDACGAWMIRNKYNDRTNIFGWEVDHIYPESKLKSKNVPQELIDNIVNLRPLNWQNNVSKGCDYPHYQSKLTSVEKKNEAGILDDYNVEREDEKEINSDVQNQIDELFKGYRL